MEKLFYHFIMLGVFFASLMRAEAASPLCPAPWVCEKLEMDVPYTTTVRHEIKLSHAHIRAGYLPEKGTFKGNVIFYQGLGDSMLNHSPLFTKLTERGFRVIAFDYMGQGGSSGSMNRTRIEFIPWIGNKVWDRFAYLPNLSKKNVIGWSTGGLAAYMLATKNQVSKIVLITPGNTANMLVGEGLNHSPINEITLSTLTTDKYLSKKDNPHIDPIIPNSPVKVPAFALNLLLTAKKSHRTVAPMTVKGFVLLSGNLDNYVDSVAAQDIFEQTAPHFIRKVYDGALHEIDNEVKHIRDEAHEDIIKFLEQDQSRI